ncbi:MAG: hypothetical protein PHD93_02025 [Candidatus Pacebacteria bacterium]|nr:hypothetical protein [Candidatus Paceibacterota bacterium]
MKKQAFLILICVLFLSAGFVFAAGACGTANGGSFASLQSYSSNLCSNGRPFSFKSVYSGMGMSGWKWKCVDGSMSSYLSSEWCSATRTNSGINPQNSFSTPINISGTSKYCGSSVNQSFSDAPTTQLCKLGTATSVSVTSTQYIWSCKMGGGITLASCSAKRIINLSPINGQCGSSDGQLFVTAPTGNLCSSGTVSSLTGSGPWNWICQGSDGGSNAYCSADKVQPAVNGQCGSSDGQSFVTAPTGNLCSSGTVSSLTGSGPWNWICQGSDGGSNAYCSAQKTQSTSNKKYKIPVLVIKYFPLDEEGKIDKKFTGACSWLSSDWDSLDVVRQTVDNFNKETISALENGSKHYGYKDESAVKSLDYEIVGTIEYLDSMPITDKVSGSTGADYDYNKIIQEVNGKDWIENKGVKEIWIWGYHTPNTTLYESNMAGPYGNISNSYRLNDMPVYSKTYTVYHYNYTRGVAEAIENHTHQIEMVLSDVDYNIFWNEFVGGDSEPFGCGWTHCPPNVMSDSWNRQYDWTSETSVISYCGGSKTEISCHNWGCDNDGGLKFKIWWMQNIPQEWWVHIGDFDGAKKNKVGLTSIK